METRQLRLVRRRRRSFTAALAFGSSLTLTSPSCRKKTKPRKGRAVAGATADFASFTRSFSRFSTNLLVLVHHPLSGSLALHVDHDVVRIADEAVASPGKFLVEVIQHDVGKKRREGRALGSAFFLADLTPSSMTPAFR